MKNINVEKVRKIVSDLCVESNLKIRGDLLTLLKKFLKKEKNPRAKNMLRILIENARIAKAESLPLCQDTGMAVVFLEIGQDIHFTGGPLIDAVTRGVADGYLKGYLRKSVVTDPLIRINTGTNTPCIIHSEIVPGNRLRLTVLPKGFGSENKSAVSMLLPTLMPDEIEDFVVDAVRKAGADACPPYIVGIGIGGTLDKAVMLSKKALLSDLTIPNSKRHIRALERNILKKINRLNVGPMGVGGKTTALAVKILTFPTHIAGCPLAVNISCNATRSASRII